MSSENKLVYSAEACRMICNSKEDNPYAGTMAEAVWKLAHDSCLSCVEACAAADAVEVIHSAWKHGNCLRCGLGVGETMSNHFHYCPNCGAKMDT